MSDKSEIQLFTKYKARIEAIRGVDAVSVGVEVGGWRLEVCWSLRWSDVVKTIRLCCPGNGSRGSHSRYG